MSHRAAIILIRDNRVALIERHRAGLHYFTFPGGHVDPGETTEQTAVREAKEELGLQVTIQRLIAIIWWRGDPQYYYLVEIAGGEFGKGTGEEMISPFQERGTYQPLWMPIPDILDQPVLPRIMAEIVVKAQTNGWPDPPHQSNE